MEHSKGKLEVVYVAGGAIGAGFELDGESAIHCFKMICNTIEARSQDYHIDKINANAEHLVTCWNAHAGLVAKAELLDAMVEGLKDKASVCRGEYTSYETCEECAIKEPRNDCNVVELLKRYAELK